MGGGQETLILCITEKPSVGRDIAQILGATTRRNGFFEGNGYCVTWTFGHLCELKEPADYTPLWRNWGLSYLPMIPQKFGIRLKNDKGIEQQFNVIKQLAENCEEIINCGDAGQEGELIQRWVLQKTGVRKPVKRLWVSSLTDEAVREGFQKLRDESELQSLYTAGLCRAIGDWLLGMNATRLYTLKYGGHRQVLSIGRVQTPTLALLVQRQKEIEDFVPTDSWELRTRYRDTAFTSTIKPFDNEEKGKAIVEKLKGLPLFITDIAKKKGKEAPPRLFDLTSLQVECNRKFGMGADQTLRAIQSLYEKKLTTYPRVDTTYLTDDIYPKCPGILSAMRPYATLIGKIGSGKLRKSKKVFDNSKVTDHHAIIPTGEAPSANLTQEEKQVYHTVALRFISAFFPDCEFEQTTVSAKAGDTAFKATGKVITSPGWKEVYAKSSTAASPENQEDSDAQILQVFTKGESGPHSPYLGKKTSQPPKYYTEGTLLKAMETAGSTVDDEDLREALKANGIGRPSTRAAIIETLYKRGYIVKERKSLRATKAGIELIGLIKEELLKSAKLTGIWENRLRQIERGAYSAPEFIDQLKKMISEIVHAVMHDPENRRITAETEEKKKNSARKGTDKTKDPEKKREADKQ